jgi:hypothetical protein
MVDLGRVKDVFPTGLNAGRGANRLSGPFDVVDGRDSVSSCQVTIGII